MIKRTISILFVLILASCVSQKVIFDEAAKAPSKEGYNENHNFLFWGVLQTQQVSPLYMCDSLENVYAIESKKSMEDVLLNIFTGGIAQVHLYTPRQSTIYCKRS